MYKAATPFGAPNLCPTMVSMSTPSSLTSTSPTHRPPEHRTWMKAVHMNEVKCDPAENGLNVYDHKCSVAAGDCALPPSGQKRQSHDDRFELTEAT